MTEDRARPLVAFVLVSLLCAFILSLNMTGQERAATATEHAAQTVPAASAVIFGDTLKPRPQSAMGGLGSLTLNDAAAGVVAVPAVTTTRHRPPRQAISRHATARHRHHTVKVTPPRQPVRHHVVTPPPIPAPVVSKHDNGRHQGWVHARDAKPGNQGNKGDHGNRGNQGNHGHGR
jgi:hypothetical protein